MQPYSKPRHALSALMVKAASRSIAPPIWRDLRIEWAGRQRNLARGSRVSGDDSLQAAVRIFVTAGMVDGFYASPSWWWKNEYRLTPCAPSKQHRPRQTYLLVMLRPLLPWHRAICHLSMSEFTTLSRLELRVPVRASAGIYVASKIELLANVICPRRPPGSPHL